MQKKLRSIIQSVFILAGIAILIYPSLSTYLSEKNGSRSVGSYDSLVEQQNEEARQKILQEASDYNRVLAEENDTGIPLTDAQGDPVCQDGYWELLDLTGNGMMGYIVIPSIDETIPIYHGTTEDVLQVGIGHVINTSFPVGGTSSHAALSGHRGLPSASLFTSLDQVQIGDRFYIKIMDRVLAYQVDQILTTDPEDTEDIAIVEGKDYVTLITCTPYGVNTHRLLVRGERIPYSSPEEEAASIPKESGNLLAKIPMQYKHLMIGLFVILVFLLIRRVVPRRKKYVGKRRK